MTEETKAKYLRDMKQFLRESLAKSMEVNIKHFE